MLEGCRKRSMGHLETGEGQPGADGKLAKLISCNRMRLTPLCAKWSQKVALLDLPPGD